MSGHFNSVYSKCYDLIYQNKPYEKEAGFIRSRILKYAPTAKSLVEFGCGSARHAEYLIPSFEKYAGIDLSADMVNAARERLGSKSSRPIELVVGDVGTAEVSGSFDVVASLFHVVSYQNSNEQVAKVLKNAHKHLNPGGIFMFDFWYTPAVLEQKPSTRIQRFENRELKVTRLVEPVVHVNKNVVDVNYELLIHENLDGKLVSIKEKHPMRHFSLPELHYFLAQAGFSVLEEGEWMTGASPSSSSWGVYIVAKK